MNYGVKISKPGVDVKTAGLKDLIFHSKYPLLKLKASGSGSFTLTDGGAGNDILVYTHNLGYKPIFFLWSTFYSPFNPGSGMVSDYQKMPVHEQSASGSLMADYYPFVNTTELRYQAQTFGGDGAGHTINFFWVLYYEPE